MKTIEYTIVTLDDEHLYVLSPEKPELGDFYLSETFGKDNFNSQMPCRFEYNDLKVYDRHKYSIYKIVATSRDDLYLPGDMAVNVPILPKQFCDECKKKKYKTVRLEATEFNDEQLAIHYEDGVFRVFPKGGEK